MLAGAGKVDFGGIAEDGEVKMLSHSISGFKCRRLRVWGWEVACKKLIQGVER